MKVTGGSIMVLALCVAVSFLLAVPAVAPADDQDRIRSYQDGGDHLDIPKIQLRLRDQISDDTGLTVAELAKYEPLMTEALELNGGDPEPIRAMFRKSVGEGCVDGCLMERLRTRNRAMKQEHWELGEAAMDQTRTRERTREQNRDQSGEQGGEQTQTQNQTQTQTQNQTQTQTQNQTQTQTRTQTQTKDQNEPGSGSGGGKGK